MVKNVAFSVQKIHHRCRSSSLVFFSITSELDGFTVNGEERGFFGKGNSPSLSFFLVGFFPITPELDGFTVNGEERGFFGKGNSPSLSFFLVGFSQSLLN